MVSTERALLCAAVRGAEMHSEEKAIFATEEFSICHFPGGYSVM